MGPSGGGGEAPTADRIRPAKWPPGWLAARRLLASDETNMIHRQPSGTSAKQIVVGSCCLSGPAAALEQLVCLLCLSRARPFARSPASLATVVSLKLDFQPAGGLAEATTC